MKFCSKSLLIAGLALFSIEALGEVSEEFRDRLSDLVNNPLQFDFNGNGRIDHGSESDAIEEAFDQLFLDEFDSDGDGELSQEEKEAMEQAMANSGIIIGGGGGGGNNGGGGGNSGGGGGNNGGGGGPIVIDPDP